MAATPTAVNSDRLEAKGTKKNGDTKSLREISKPYAVQARIVGTEVLLMHRYDIEATKSKANAKKGSEEKKTDNVESYIYRAPDSNEIGIPGLALKAAIAEAGRYAQDPRSPRKSARDLIRAGIRVRGFGLLGKKAPDFIDSRPVLVQRNRIVRSRPAFNPGWAAEFTVEVLLAEYVSPDFLSELITNAGRFVGLLDGRPDFGVFRLEKFTVLKG